MKKLLSVTLSIVIATCCLISSAQAQKWSAGFRTGIGQVNCNLDEHDFDSYNLLWNNQLFLARKLGKRFELELTANYSQRKDQFTTTYFAGNGTNYYDVTQHRITLGLGARYYFLRIKPFEAYGQLGFNCEKYIGKNLITTYENGKPPRQYNATENINTVPVNMVFAGLGFNYDICRTLFLSANINVYNKVYGFSYTGDRYQYYNDWTTALFIGGGFRF